jgi:hypothetical protein
MLKLLKLLTQMMKSIGRYLWSLIPSRRVKVAIQPESSKKFTNGVRYIIEELKASGSKELAHSMAQVSEVIYDAGKMDLDVHAIYLNIARGYKIKDVYRTQENKVLVYFEISEKPFVLQPRTSYNSARDI